MPIKARELKSLDIRRLQQPGLHAVGGVDGLALQVSDTGARSWILRAMIGGRRHKLGLGGFPDVPLDEARSKAREYRAQIRAGQDPLAERQAAREALRAATAHRVTFRQAAEQYLEIKLAELKNPRHQAAWRSTLEQYAYPVIGSKALSALTLQDMLAVLEPIWLTKTQTASKVRNRIENVISWAKVRGYLDGENVARWQGNLEVVLAKPSKIAKTTHRAALVADEMPAFMERLRRLGGLAPRALELLILSGCRTGEVLGARWDEFDTEAKMWTVPAERMKGGREHVVPVTAAMQALLDSLPRHGGGFVFEKANGKPLGASSLINLMRKRLESSATPHGFRSTFKDWARTEHPEVPDEVSELQLAHVSNDATRAAYARDKLLEQRKSLMEAWAEHCNCGAQKAREAA